MLKLNGIHCLRGRPRRPASFNLFSGPVTIDQRKYGRELSPVTDYLLHLESNSRNFVTLKQVDLAQAETAWTSIVDLRKPKAIPVRGLRALVFRLAAYV